MGIDIENEVFQRTKPDFSKFIPYGFAKIQNQYHLETDFMDGAFRAILNIDSKGNVSGTVIDKMNGEEYVPLRNSVQNGAYVSSVRNAYRAVLDDIAKSCYIPTFFAFEQSNRICELIYEFYGDRPNFPWNSNPYQYAGTFRHKDTSKWYCVIMPVKKSTFDKFDDDSSVEIINLKIDEKYRERLQAQDGIYPAYHMSHKCWISVLLDNTVSDQYIMELLHTSYRLTQKRRA